ncbi:ubiquitin-like domain-containing protein [Phanerochaete sordida]|uniref:Ubiquitin-like domain-containing protein n=1 Tax=Phanerochaete sordida TaxID=48140 RepID=A0A9P3G657_9APHY|nr:ubiquitin-like domain-containing protein [Phanerochaete sordida]
MRFLIVSIYSLLVFIGLVAAVPATVRADGVDAVAKRGGETLERRDFAITVTDIAIDVTWTIPVSYTDDGAAVKSKVSTASGIGLDPADMTLTYNGRVIDDHTSIAAYAIGPGASLDVYLKTAADVTGRATVRTLVRRSPVTMELLDGTKFTLDVDLNETGATLKQQIQQHTGIATTSQRLVYNDQVVADANTLASYGIGSGSDYVHVVTEFQS